MGLEGAAEGCFRAIPGVERNGGDLGPIHSGLRNEPARTAAFDEAFLQYIRRWNRDTTGERVRIVYEYLLVVARKRDA